MTPQTNNHLTEEQFGDLLSGSGPTPETALAEAHFLACAQCAAELDSLRASLSLFRQATVVYADNHLRPLSQEPIRIRPAAFQSAYWATAAAALLLAAILPLQRLHRHSPPPASTIARVADRPTESDEALLESVNTEITESVPTPMKALADPTAHTTSY